MVADCRRMCPPLAAPAAMFFGFRLQIVAVSLTLLGSAGAAISARAETQPPLLPVGMPETRLLADAADGELQRHSLLRAALIAGGIADERELSDWQDCFAYLCEPLQQRTAAGETLTPKELFAFLHSEILTGEYNAAVTTLPATLRSGNYNCLTATVLLLELGDRYQVQLEAVSTSGHIYCRHLGPEPCEIETTCPTWFQSGRTASEQPIARRFASSRNINRVQVVAKIYYNRGLALLADKQFAMALPLLERSQQLDPHDADARENLLAGVNNWALSLAEADRFAEAVQLIERGKRIEPSYPPFAANELHTYQRWAAWHCARREYSAALAVLEQGRTRQPSALLFVAGPRTVYAEWLAWLERQGDRQAMTEVLAAAGQCLDPSAHAQLQAHLQFTLATEPTAE
jgi:tetratricopeptide (TPR) repeat protein